MGYPTSGIHRPRTGGGSLRPARRPCDRSSSAGKIPDDAPRPTRAAIARARRALEAAARCADRPALRRGLLASCGLAVLAIDRDTLVERHPFARLSAYAIVAILLGRRPEGRLAVLATIAAAFLLLPWTETFDAHGRVVALYGGDPAHDRGLPALPTLFHRGHHPH